MQKPRIVCRCGREVTLNTWAVHLRSSACSLDSATKGQMASVLEKRREFPRGWLKTSGEEALADAQWYVSVMLQETRIDDWAFASPRQAHCPRPSALRTFSANRRGGNNPNIKAKKPPFSREEVLSFAKEVFAECVSDETMAFGDIERIVEQRYPKFRFLTDFGRGASFLCLISGLSLKEVSAMSRKRRGVFISMGQRASSIFAQRASECGSKTMSAWRVTIPHRILFELLKTVDSEVQLEYRMLDPYGKSKSFDVYSPKISAVLEMHGRYWHDVNGGANEKMLPLVKKNIDNDQTKRKIADSAGLRYLVFWDDEKEQWTSQIEGLYGTKPRISVEEAEDKIRQESGEDAGL